MKNRKFREAVGAEMSTIRNTENGVVQDAVLSVTLFLISMSQINKNDDSSTGFADDWIIYTRHHSLQSTQTNIQAAVDKISYWARNIGFQISPEKPVSMHIRRPKPRIKILGVFFDS
jgi:hypothetical protein